MRELTLIAFSLVILNAEPSAFGAGDLDSSNPYGLTQSEKSILKNKKLIESQSKDLNLIKLDVNNINESIDGLKSVIEGQNNTILSLKKELSNIKSNINTQSAVNENSIETLQTDLNSSLSDVSIAFNSLNSDINATFVDLKNAINKMSKTVNKIYSNYIPKKELNRYIQNEFKRFSKEILNEVEKSVKSVSKKQKTETFDTKKDNPSLYKEARALYKKREYSRAKEIFKYLIKKKYRPATDNFYLGEIEYYNKNYSDAIYYYKKSAELYDKSSFMPTLLLHIAISFEKTNDKDSSIAFYNALIDSFPDTKESSIAKKNLNKQK